jgi:uncharacterized membrane protein
MSNRTQAKPRQHSSTKTKAGVAETEKKVVAVAEQHSFSGPLPHPEIMIGYNKIVPNAAERILAMAESDAEHQREIEMFAITSTRNEARLGQILGFTIGISALIVALICALNGQENVAMVIGGTTVVGLVSAFIIGRIKSPSSK